MHSSVLHVDVAHSRLTSLSAESRNRARDHQRICCHAIGLGPIHKLDLSAVNDCHYAADANTSRRRTPTCSGCSHAPIIGACDMPQPRGRSAC
jgi:hypothetical protein